MKGYIVPLLQITHSSIQAFSFIIIWLHLMAVAGQDSPVAAAVFLGCQPKCLGAELPDLSLERLQRHRALLFTFHSVLSVRFSCSAPPLCSFQQDFIYQPRPPSHHLAVLIPPRSARPLYLILLADQSIALILF